MALPLETTTFQDGVRKEWIQAVFGEDFPQKGKDDTDINLKSAQSSGSGCSRNDSVTSAWKGVGLAQIPSYTTYTVELSPLHERDDSLPVLDSDEKKDGSPSPLPRDAMEATTQKLGMTLSRLTLGLYVRHVHPGSEAWCAGVQPNSVLVSINHGTINLLAEPTKAALERIWQYEGFGSTSSQISSAMIIREPVSMTFILHGKLYDVLFLSNPPYGIDWAPCGNFCLVKKVTSLQAKRAGIQASSIIAGIATVEDQATETIDTLDHLSAAEALKKAVASNKTIRLQFCAPPSTARSGHWEREQDAAMKEIDNKRTAQAPSSSSSERNTAASQDRPKLAMEVDGVQVRIHPLLGGSGGLLRRSLSTPNMREPSLVSLSHMAAQVATGDPFPLNLTSYKTRTWRHGNDAATNVGNDAAEILTRPSYTTHHGRPRDRANYRPCPRLEKPILEYWDSQQALIYLFRHHLADYNEQDVLLLATDDRHAIDFLQQGSSAMKQEKEEATMSFLLFWMAWLTTNNNSITLSLSQRLMEMSEHNVLFFAHPMEYLSWAFQNEDIQNRLARFRKNRLQVAHRRQAHEQPQGGMSSQTSGIAKRDESASSVRTTSEHGRPLKLTCVSNEKVEESQQKHTEGSKEKVPKRRFRLFRKKKASRRDKGRTKSPLEEPPTKVDPVRGNTSTDRHTNLTSLTPKDARVIAAPREDSAAYAIPIESSSTNISYLDSIFANSLPFLEELEAVCENIEKSLMQSFSQKFARWALQPWTSSKETALAQVTHAMRERLKVCNQPKSLMPLLNPANSMEVLLSIDTSGCYILPSAHFPLLLTFDCRKETPMPRNKKADATLSTNPTSKSFGEERLYRTTVELVQLKGSRPRKDGRLSPRGFKVHGSVAGSIVESERSTGIDRDFNHHVWDIGNILVFDSRSSWGPPKTLCLRFDANGESLDYQKGFAYCWVDLSPFWENFDCLSSSNTGSATVKAQVVASAMFKRFDEHGILIDSPPDKETKAFEDMEIEILITPKILETAGTMKKSLLYKHDDDVRQEMFAIEFIKSCDRILRSCGLDMKMLLFRCIAVGKRKGFIEWVHGSVPLSEICQPSLAGSILGKREKGRVEDVSNRDPGGSDSDDMTLSSVAKAGLSKYQSLSLVRSEAGPKAKPSPSPAAPNNPIQDFLRSCAYDSKSPFNIKKEVMDTYIKSCAGYSVCTFLLGVGDRHLDNLLLHQSGHFFHCDYSFILGNDPKKHLPMRITEDMVNGMGGWESDNFCQFLSLACAVFLTLRRPENVRHLLSLVRLMEGSGLPDLEVNQSLEAAIDGIRDRLHLDFTDEEAITFMEKLIEESCLSKMWMAVDAIHSFAQRF